MISLFLDESGNFENVNYKVKFIGGLIYTGPDLKQEGKKLEKYLKDTCKHLNIKYPNEIHTTELNNKQASIRIKESLKESMISYINSNNKYHFVYLINGSNKKTYINNTSNIIEEKNASNLYDNMIANLVQNTIFYNPFLQDEEYMLKIATRIAVISQTERLKISGYEKLGYKSRLSQKGEYIFNLNSNISIKAAISSKIIENRIDRDIKTIDLDVKSINYKKYPSDKEKSTTPFLYAADIACDIIKTIIADVSDPENQYKSLGRKLRNIRQADFYIGKVSSKLEEISGNKTFVWAYDDIEELWGDLNLSVYRKDLLSALECLYKIKVSSSPFAKFYYDFWCKGLIKDIKLIFDENELNLYLSKIETYSLNKHKAEYEKGLFIAEHINNILLSSNIKYKDKYIFKLNDILLRGYNHRGDTINGHKCIEICKKREDYVSILEYIDFMTRELQVYVNEFNYNKCIEKAEEIIFCLDIYKDVEKEIANYLGKQPEGNIRMGKNLSSLGQFYSFKQKKDLALEKFEQALIEFKDSDIDIKITKLYLRHLAVEQKDYTLFIKYSGKQWKSKELESIFDEIVKSKDKFELYLYLKAIDAFYLVDLTDELWNKVLVTDYNKAGFEFVHPWELIYKYMAIISLKNGFKRDGQNRIERIDEIVEKAETIKLININSKIEYMILESQMDKTKNKNINNKKIQAQIKDMINLLDKYPRIKSVFKSVLSNDGKMNLEELKNIFTYMYR